MLYAVRDVVPWGALQVFQIGGDGGSRFRGGGIVLLSQEGFEIQPTVKCGHAFRRLVTLLALGCVKYLTALQIFLCYCG